MPGLDLPLKLRRLGKGSVLPPEEVTRRLLIHDGDQDGEITQKELTTFLVRNRVGGPWFCQVLSKTLWQLAQDRWGTEVDAISAQTLGRIISFSMARAGRPAKRYVLTPEAVRGLEPKRDLAGNVVKSTGPRPGPAVRAPPGRSTPRPGAAPGRAAPRGARPAPRPGARPTRSRRPGPKPRR